MGKTVKGKEKAAVKVARKKRKLVRKCKGTACALLLFGLALLCGCATSDSQQPAKANTMSNTFDDCIIIVAAKAKLPLAGTNRVVEAEGGDLPTLELFTQTQSLENTGSTETISPTSTQTPTTDVKPDIDVHYNDAIKNATDASKGVLEKLTDSGAAAVLKLMQSKEKGTVQVQQKDGSTATVQCENGQCSICTDGTCSP